MYNNYMNIEAKLAEAEDAEKLHKLFVQAAQFKHKYNDDSWRDGFSLKGTRWIINENETYLV